MENVHDDFAFNITQCFGRSVMENNNLSRPIYLKFIVYCLLLLLSIPTLAQTVPEHSQHSSKGLKNSHSFMQICLNSEYNTIQYNTLLTAPHKGFSVTMLQLQIILYLMNKK
jgi:hypothetical protein